MKAALPYIDRLLPAHDLAALPGAAISEKVDADVTISGVLAQFGRGMIEQVAKKMFQEFTAAVKLALESG